MFNHPLIFALPLCNVLFLKHLICTSSFSKYISWCLIWLLPLLAILSKENMFCHNILDRDLLFLSVSLDDFLVLPFGYFGSSYSYWAFLRCYRTWRFPICSSNSLKRKYWDLLCLRHPFLALCQSKNCQHFKERTAAAVPWCGSGCSLGCYTCCGACF